MQYFRFFYHKNMKFRINSYDDLPLDKTLNIPNVAILINSVFNKDYNHYKSLNLL